MLDISEKLAEQIKLRARQEHKTVEEFLLDLLGDDDEDRVGIKLAEEISSPTNNANILSLLVDAADDNRLINGKEDDD